MGPSGAFSVIVDDFCVKSVSLLPSEAQPPLVVDSYRVLTLSVSLESLQAVAREASEILETRGRVEHSQLSFGLLSKGIERRDPLPLPEALGFLVGKGPEHRLSFKPSLCYALRQA